MTNQYWKQYPTGSAEQVVAHAEYRLWLGKSPSMAFGSTRNPRHALYEAFVVLNTPTAIVRSVGGQLVMEDPVASAVISAIGKRNCIATLTMNADRVAHFKRRLAELNRTPADTVIVLINADDPYGRPFADLLMPGADFQQFRDAGQVPYARGLAGRDFMQDGLDALDPEAAKTLREMTEGIAVVIVDHCAAEVFVA